MNFAILTPEVQEFLKKNYNTNLSNLALKGSPFTNITTIELLEQLESLIKSKDKLPTWFVTENIYYPNKLNISQTSSEVTALHKTSLVEGISMIDLTGGLGIDDYYFSKKFEKLLHCELNENLSAIAQHNFKQLGVKNIEFVTGDGLAFLQNTTENFDLIYADPSRRDENKNRVFLLKDCLPNIPNNLSWLFEKAPKILIKNSPLIDITQGLQELTNTKNIYIIAAANEVKEVLFLMEKNYTGPVHITATNLESNQQNFSFYFNTDATVNYSHPLRYLYEPNAAILKSGGFNEVSNQFNLHKLHQHTHLYTSNELIIFPGRSFEITHQLKYQKKEILKLLPHKKANITTRNFKETVTDIRKKTGIKEGGDTYLFFTTNINNESIVLICKKV